MESLNKALHGPAHHAWKPKPVETVRPTVILTLDRNGNPEMPGQRKGGGYYPYVTSGKISLRAQNGMLIDVSA